MALVVEAENKNIDEVENNKNGELNTKITQSLEQENLATNEYEKWYFEINNKREEYAKKILEKI